MGRRLCERDALGLFSNALPTRASGRQSGSPIAASGKRHKAAGKAGFVAAAASCDFPLRRGPGASSPQAPQQQWLPSGPCFGQPSPQPATVSASPGKALCKRLQLQGAGGIIPPAAGGLCRLLLCRQLPPAYCPAISRKRRMRSSVGGWVENSEAMDMPAKGLTINMFSVAGLAFMGICRE